MLTSGACISIRIVYIFMWHTFFREPLRCGQEEFHTLQESLHFAEAGPQRSSKARQAGGRPKTYVTSLLIAIQPFASDEALRKSCLVQDKQQNPP